MGLSDLGGALTWGECQVLLQSAAEDPSTVLGAHIAGWAYPASMVDLISLTAQIRDKQAVRDLMPWSPSLAQRDVATADEVATAVAELEDEFVFA